MAEEETTTTEETTEAQAEAAAPAEETTAAVETADRQSGNLEFLLDVPVRLTAELGSCKMTM